MSAGGLRGLVSEESKNPNPVSGAGPSTLRGLFHPYPSTVRDLGWSEVSEMLNLH